MAKKKTRQLNEINAGTMADIAFLLLIFFLVTTTIDVDKGVLVKLPPWSLEEPPTLNMKTRNVFSVLVNADNQLLVRNEFADVKDLRASAKEFIRNPNNLENMAERPDKAIISLRNDRGTKYSTYLEVYNELKAAYRELREDESKKRFAKSYEFLDNEKKKEINTLIPLVLSEAEPTNFGEE